MGEYKCEKILYVFTQWKKYIGSMSDPNKKSLKQYYKMPKIVPSIQHKNIGRHSYVYRM